MGLFRKKYVPRRRSRNISVTQRNLRYKLPDEMPTKKQYSLARALKIQNPGSYTKRALAIKISAKMSVKNKEMADLRRKYSGQGKTKRKSSGRRGDDWYNPIDFGK